MFEPYYITEKDLDDDEYDIYLIEIFDREKNEKIGEYRRFYIGGEQTFAPFLYKDKWYALYSHDYTRVDFMTLPDCNKMTLDNQSIANIKDFFPQEIWVPSYKWDDRRKKYITCEMIESDDDDEDDLDVLENKYKGFKYHTFAFVYGHHWGEEDNNLIKILDFSQLDKGLVKYSHEYTYTAPKAVKYYTMRENIQLEYFDDKDMLGGSVNISINKTISFEQNDEKVDISD